ncbi:hypothetical protein [Pseudomonas sp. JAI120]|uniref:hypothetical protein n=1 Tax=Pseudomonas sp. JAI120 TaxID=2723063 RepID=UPI0030DBD91B
MKTEQNKPQPLLKICQLYGQEEIGEISHIIPRLVSKVLAKDPSTSNSNFSAKKPSSMSKAQKSKKKNLPIRTYNVLSRINTFKKTFNYLALENENRALQLWVNRAAPTQALRSRAFMTGLSTR